LENGGTEPGVGDVNGLPVVADIDPKTPLGGGLLNPGSKKWGARTVGAGGNADAWRTSTPMAGFGRGDG